MEEKIAFDLLVCKTLKDKYSLLDLKKYENSQQISKKKIVKINYDEIKLPISLTVFNYKKGKYNKCFLFVF